MNVFNPLIIELCSIVLFSMWTILHIRVSVMTVVMVECVFSDFEAFFITSFCAMFEPEFFLEQEHDVETYFSGHCLIHCVIALAIFGYLNIDRQIK